VRRDERGTAPSQRSVSVRRVCISSSRLWTDPRGVGIYIEGEVGNRERWSCDLVEW
jgi:hypothetical protein